MRKTLILLTAFMFLSPIAHAGTVRVLYKADETIAVIIPAPQSRKANETEEAWLERVFEKISENIDFVDFEDVEQSTLPSRQYRKAWKGNKQTGVKVDQEEKEKIDTEKQVKERMDGKLRTDAIKELIEEGKLSNGYK